MKLKKSGFDFQFLDDHDEGDFLLSSKSSNLKIVGHAIDNILYINESHNMSQVLAVSTRSSFKRKHSQIPDNARRFKSTGHFRKVYWVGRLPGYSRKLYCQYHNI